MLATQWVHAALLATLLASCHASTIARVEGADGVDAQGARQTAGGAGGSSALHGHSAGEEFVRVGEGTAAGHREGDGAGEVKRLARLAGEGSSHRRRLAQEGATTVALGEGGGEGGSEIGGGGGWVGGGEGESKGDGDGERTSIHDGNLFSGAASAFDLEAVRWTLGPKPETRNPKP